MTPLEALIHARNEIEDGQLCASEATVLLNKLISQLGINEQITADWSPCLRNHADKACECQRCSASAVMGHGTG